MPRVWKWNHIEETARAGMLVVAKDLCADGKLDNLAQNGAARAADHLQVAGDLQRPVRLRLNFDCPVARLQRLVHPS